MVVVGAAFTARAAPDAARALAQLPGLDPKAIARAPLGAVGRVSEGMVLVAVCISERAIDQVARIVDQFGGQIVSRASYPGPGPGEPSPDRAPLRPSDHSGSPIPGRPHH
jgi:hypothetical protein